LPLTGRSLAILIVVEPVVGVELPVLEVPAPQAARMANNRGMPIVKAKIRDQLLLMMLLASLNTKYKSLFRGGKDDYAGFLKLAPLINDITSCV